MGINCSENIGSNWKNLKRCLGHLAFESLKCAVKTKVIIRVFKVIRSVEILDTGEDIFYVTVRDSYCQKFCKIAQSLRLCWKSNQAKIDTEEEIGSDVRDLILDCVCGKSKTLCDDIVSFQLIQSN